MAIHTKGSTQRVPIDSAGSTTGTIHRSIHSSIHSNVSTKRVPTHRKVSTKIGLYTVNYGADFGEFVFLGAPHRICKRWPPRSRQIEKVGGLVGELVCECVRVVFGFLVWHTRMGDERFIERKRE